MYLDLPIEQLVRRKDTRFQYGFATEAKKRVPARGEFLLSASNKGLHVLARNEDDLATPVEVLPLAALLGLPDELATLTGHSAKHWIALSHYALLTPDPGGRAA